MAPRGGIRRKRNASRARGGGGRPLLCFEASGGPRKLACRTATPRRLCSMRRPMSETETLSDLTDWPFIPARSPRITGGDGAWLIADDGKRILDAAGGAIVTNIGHGRREVADAIAKA